MLAAAAIPRHSKELLNLRKIQDTLARNKRYEEAAKLKAKADELVRKPAWRGSVPEIVQAQAFVVNRLLLSRYADDVGRRKVA